MALGDTIGDLVPDLVADTLGISGYVLDSVNTTNLSLAVSAARQVISGYAGQAVNVKELGGGTTTDIAFLGGELDTASIATFCGANNGVLQTIYDQSGGGFNLLNTLGDTRGMLIYDGSVVPTQNSRAVMDGAGQSSPVMQANDGLGITGNPGIDLFVVVAQWTLFRSPFRLGQTTSGAYIDLFLQAADTARVRHGDGQVDYDWSGLDLTEDAPHLVHVRSASGGDYASYAISVDGVAGSFVSSVNGTNTVTLADENCSAPTSLSGSFQGAIGEVFLFSTASGNALSTSDASLLTTLIKDYWGIA